jgi:ATP-binding cassette subfamily C protein CydC
LLAALTGGAMLAALVIAIPRVEGVSLAMIVLGISASFEALAPLPLAAQHLGATLESARRLFEIADTPPAVLDPPHGLTAPAHFDLEFRDVSFRYTADAPLALERVSLSLKEGEHLLLAGPSGAGKSTLVNLLLRFWEPDSGDILLGGKPIQVYSLEDLRSWISVTPQQTQLFNATILDNLRLARPDASRKQIVEAARRACIHDWIEGLPQGYETWVGEQGLRLSGGERQRIAIARALLTWTPSRRRP